MENIIIINKIIINKMENIISLTQKNGSEDVTTSNFKYYSYYDITLNIIYLV